MMTSAQTKVELTQPAWLLRFVSPAGVGEVWTVYSDGRRYAIAKREGKVPEYHLFEKGAVISDSDRSKHRLLWAGKLTRAGREYLELTQALSNAADRIMRANSEAQCRQCRKLMPLSEIGQHPCREN